MATSLKIDQLQVQKQVPVTVLRLKGDIDATTFEDFQKKAIAAVNGGARYLLLDLSGVNYMSSAGLRALKAILDALSLKNEAAAPGGMFGSSFKSPYLKILNPGLVVQKSLHMVGFDMLIDAFTDFDAAVASF
jgi:ABC-type transporter Mla MlaB component